MMLLLGRLISLLLLLPRPRGRTLLNLPMLLLEFLTLILMRRFVRRSRLTAVQTALEYTLILRRIIRPVLVRPRCVGTLDGRVTGTG
ncbi:hypothetical protein ANAPC1_01045 [Anaplasma phagocytophilum]|uniref:Uncharacterized protein n=1 Tax=Anaplasma phagocytophilum TaxID=948 RepID=A0AA45ZHT8_ANAPH|nr:hypothetical protein [Anaplasma phagocytophilum]SBO14682.1 hypothetical protein ANAPC1_01045 [Anaplasma phagocytophilum]SBO33883.1 hypothetical protein ANAPC4_01340 [Anaplasma phagocytophilum]